MRVVESLEFARIQRLARDPRTFSGDFSGACRTKRGWFTEKERDVAPGDVNSIGDRNASVQPGDALETELERTRRLTVVDDVADGLWLDLILTLRFAYAPPPLDESPKFIEKREDLPRPASPMTPSIDPSLLIIGFT